MAFCSFLIFTLSISSSTCSAASNDRLVPYAFHHQSAGISTTTARRRIKINSQHIINWNNNRCGPPSPQNALSLSQINNHNDDGGKQSLGRKERTIISPNIALDYINALRPVTVIQAVGALLVGYLALTSGAAQGSSITTAAATTATRNNVVLFSHNSKRILAAAALSVYLSYGAGMVMNDCVDATTDSLHDTKNERAIASGRISKRAGWAYCALLSSISLGLGYVVVGARYAIWTCSNLGLMLGYAFGLQRIFLVKNMLVGWLAVSPLVGAAATLSSNFGGIRISSFSKLVRLAAVGFSMQVTREILKDIEDMDVDQLGKNNKVTLPLVVGEKVAHRIAFGIVGIVCSAIIFTPWYWEIFVPSKYAMFPLSVLVGVPMCVRASRLAVDKGQELLKKSIFVLLAGMIGSMMTQ